MAGLMVGAHMPPQPLPAGRQRPYTADACAAYRCRIYDRCDRVPGRVANEEHSRHDIHVRDKR